jgi:hypothetical protein
LQQLGGRWGENWPVCNLSEPKSSNFPDVLYNEQERSNLSGLRVQGFGKRGVGFLPVVATVCLILVTFLAIAQVAHLHSNPTDADHCQLCIVMHTVAPTATATVAILLVRLGASTPVAEPIFVARQPQFRLFSRPPPVSR